MEKINSSTRFILKVSILVALIFAFTIPALAGSNGQQISIYACAADRISIRGYNQNGQPQTKTFDKSVSKCGWINVTGWWWVGSVNVYAYYFVTPEYPYYFGQNVRAQVPRSQSNSNFVFINIPTPTADQWKVWRSATWVSGNIAYDNSKYHDGYRQDCSGYVSFAWSLPKSYTGDDWMSFANQINFDDLQPGDALDNPQKGDLGHMILFVKWVDKKYGSFLGNEENGWYGYTRNSTYTLNKSTRVIKDGSYTYPGTYIAITKK